MMKINKKVSFHKAITTSREFFKEGTGIKCVHYGDIYKNYSGKKVCSSNIINSFANPVAAEKMAPLPSAPAGNGGSAVYTVLAAVTLVFLLATVAFTAVQYLGVCQGIKCDIPGMSVMK